MLRLIPLPVWFGIGGVIIAGAAGYGFWMYSKGKAAVRNQFDAAVIERTRTVRDANHRVNSQTYKDDAALQAALEELSKVWLSPQPQDAPPLPSSSPSPGALQAP